MNHLNQRPNKLQPEENKNSNDSGQNSLKDILGDWIKCREEVNALNKKLFSLCKSDKELHWLKSRGLLNFPED